MMNEQIKLATSSTKCEGYCTKGWLERLELDELEDQLNVLLVHNLPDRIRGRSHQVAFDLTFIPYHGEAKDSPDEVRRSRATSGTTHFHVYASANIIRHNRRVTIAVVYVRAGQSLLEVLLYLLQRLNSLDMSLKRLLLDRQFATVEVIRYLDRQAWQSVLPVPARGDELQDLKRSTRRSQVPGLHRALADRRPGHFQPAPGVSLPAWTPWQAWSRTLAVGRARSALARQSR